MTQSPHLSRLRFGLKSLYVLQSAEHTTTTPGLHHLLSIPIRERLILLALIDGADERAIRQTMSVAKDDATLSSRRMKRTVQRMKAHLTTPHAHWPEVWLRDDLTPDGDLTNGLILQDSQGIAWNRRYGASLESTLGQLLWSDVAVCLLGQSVPPQVATLSLRTRMIIYCLVVEGCTQDETIRIMGCTEWDIDRSLRDGLRAVGGL
jgi:hypothetical protein